MRRDRTRRISVDSKSKRLRARTPFVSAKGRPISAAVALAGRIALPATVALVGPVASAFPAALGAQDPPAAEPADHEPVVGIWEGPLELPGGAALRIVFHLETDEGGGLAASMDSPDQGARGIPGTEARFAEGDLTLAFTNIGARFHGTLAAADRLTGNWEQGGQSFPLTLERVDEPSGPERPQDPERPVPYREEDVRYTNAEAGIELAGTLSLPRGPGPFPAVALVSGSGPQDRNSEIFDHRPFLVLADHLTRRGIAVLRSDDRGVAESGGDFGAATSRDFASDAAAAIEYLGTRPEVEPGAVGIVGMSEGGIIAPLVQTEYGTLDFLVLLAAPGLTGEEILHLQSALIARAAGVPEERIEWNREVQDGLFAIVKEEADEDRRAERMEAFLHGTVEDLPETEREAMGLGGDAAEAWVGAQVAAMRGSWFRFFLVHDPREELQEVRVPVLALNGGLDLQVPATENLAAIEDALAEAGNRDVTLRELPGLNHLFQSADTGAPTEYATIEETMSPEAMELVAQWVLERFGGPAP